MTEALRAQTTRHWTDYQVGQLVYCHFDKERNRYLTVRSVGRKYVRFEGLPYERVVERGSQKLVSRNYGQIGQLYESEAAYEEDYKLSALKDKIARRNYHSWHALPEEKIRAIAQILEINT